MDYALFIDTNILLDFYRARNDAQLHLLDRIDELKDHILTTYQVEMEFKKNRQKAILDAIGGIKMKAEPMSIPAFLKKAKAAGAIDSKRKDIDKHIRTLRDRAKSIMLNPTKVDPVYKTTQRLFTHTSPLVLARDDKIKKQMRRLAFKRFILGYPPRKNSDITIGDAINWEWVIHVAEKEKRHVVIASRDSDFGVTVDGSSYLNDWLHREFRERVSKKRNCILTDRLTEALKIMDVQVSPEEEREESELVTTGDHVPNHSQSLHELLAEIAAHIDDVPQPDGDDDGSGKSKTEKKGRD